MKEQEDDDNGDDGEMLNKKKLEFLGGFDASFREKTPPDMLLFSDDKQPPLPAHKAVLVILSLSLIFLFYIFIATSITL